MRRSDGLRSELSMLEEMLARIPTDRVLERVGLQGRAARLREEIDALPPDPKTIALTFRGDPVEGSHSIVADFAGKAVAAFSEAIGTLAASLSGDLGAAGPLPGGQERALRIVGPALGSYGFELELPAPSAAPQSVLFNEPERDPVESAVKQVMTLLDVSQHEDEEALADVLATLHSRALSKLRDFVKLVAERQASFTLRSGDRVVAVPDDTAGRRVVAVLAETNIRTEEHEFLGRLWILPASGQFELHSRLHGVIKGRIDRGVQGLEALIGTEVHAQLRETYVRQARPRHTLLSATAQQ